MGDGTDDLNRLRHILDRLDPEQRAALIEELEDVATTDKPELSVVPAPVEIEPYRESRGMQGEAVLDWREVAGFLPAVEVQIEFGEFHRDTGKTTIKNLYWHIGPAGKR